MCVFNVTAYASSNTHTHTREQFNTAYAVGIIFVVAIAAIIDYVYTCVL